jgi:hypothetical protein
MLAKKTVRMLVTSIVLMSTHGAQAEDNAPLFIWDNQEGISAADLGCQVEATDKVPFKVSQYYGQKNSLTESLRNYNGVRQSHMVNHSIVKLVPGQSKFKYSPVEVVGLNQRTEAVANRWFSERGDRGYLYDLFFETS